MVTPLYVTALIVLFGQLSLAEKDKQPDARLGLLATSLGVAPVPGLHEYNVGGGGSDVPIETYQSGGIQGGNGLALTKCRCTLKEQCASAGGGLNVPNQHIPIVGENAGKPHVDDGLTSGYGEPGGGDAPSSGNDGAGVIDVRIVNRPQGCPAGHINCCDGPSQPDSTGYPGPGGGSPGGAGGVPGGNGYVTCGSRNIINIPGFTPEYGQAQFGEYPWMAVILGKDNNYIGAGALISPYYVLTAAHKVSKWTAGTPMKVRFGEWNAQDDTEPYKNVEIDVADVKIHDQFNPNNLYNDVALIKLSAPVDLNAYPHIKSACLPSYADNFVGQRCWVAGFGKDAFGNGKHSYIMREVDVPVVDTYDCQRRLRSTRLGPQFELHKKSFLCAGGEEGKDACSGDGGSPLVCEANGKWTVAGLVAWGIGCADYGVPGVYANVPNYVQWIEANIY